ncbi:MAG: hypothetical protein WDN06_12350 [Asticcacaulis sp.]
MAAAAILLVAGFAMAAGVYGSGLLEKGWSDQIVWKVPDVSYEEAGRCETEDCLKGIMTKSGAKAESVDFATAYGTFIAGGDWPPGYVENFIELGRVDLAEITMPRITMGNDIRYVFLDKKAISDPVSDKDLENRLRGDSHTAFIWRNYPDVFLTYDRVYVRGDKLPDNGQRIVFKASVAECMACAVIAAPEYAFDFDRYGQYQGLTVLDAGFGRQPTFNPLPLASESPPSPTTDQIAHARAAVFGSAPPVPH